MCGKFLTLTTAKNGLAYLLKHNKLECGNWQFDQWQKMAGIVKIGPSHELYSEACEYILELAIFELEGCEYWVESINGVIFAVRNDTTKEERETWKIKTFGKLED